ncbi:hypothetical protein IZU99_07925 [Oscillospiraceae bacterium CM]|nr:hypothetical protein IZU99_07925 [Oscillospiraceae bacterium CM]
MKRFLWSCFCFLFVMTLPSCSLSNTPSGYQQNVAEESQAQNADVTINIDDVKANFYYIYELIHYYISFKEDAMNDIYFIHIYKDFLDENYPIYQSEMQYIEDCASKNIHYELDYCIADVDVEELPNNLYKVVYDCIIRETDSNKVVTEIKKSQVFTVYDDGKIQKIRDIQDVSDTASSS